MDEMEIIRKKTREQRQKEIEEEKSTMEKIKQQNEQRRSSVRHTFYDSIKMRTSPENDSDRMEIFDRVIERLSRARTRAQERHSIHPSIMESNVEAEYEIDPITNRRVYKNTTSKSEETRKSIDVPVNSFKGYRSQFQGFAPPESKSQKYSWNQEISEAPKQDPVQEGLKAYDAKADYETSRGYDPASMDIDYSDPDQAACKAYDEKISSKETGFASSVSHGAETVDPVEEGLKAYDEKVDYETRALYDPAKMDIDYSDPDEAGCKAYDEKLSRLSVNGEIEISEPVSIHKGPMLDETELNAAASNRGSDPVQQALEDYDHSVNSGHVKQDPIELEEQVFKPMREFEANMLRERAEKREEAVGAEHEQKHPLLKSLREYNDTGAHEQVMEVVPEAQEKLQKGLEEYDEKVDYSSGALYDPAQMDIDYSDPDQAACKAYDEKISSGGNSNEMSETNVTIGAEVDSSEDLESLRASDIRAAFAKFNKSDSAMDSKAQVENFKVENSELQNTAAHIRGRVDAKIAELDKGSEGKTAVKKPTTMTGNYVRDFPEEFETSWTAKGGASDGLTPSRKLEAEVQGAESIYINGLASKEDFARNPDTPRLQTSMDRNTPDKQNSTNLKREKHKELVREVRGIYEEAYGVIDSKHRQVPETSSAEAALTLEPTMYKILAYDPTMQSISTAETTSIVNDASSPLTPAEVLLRLSNPAKFFPHFGPLQSQGYEIVSGSGDVLVFRKVRSGPPPNQGSSSSSEAQTRGVNPIDGMRSPIAATGNFASPTGFVNHDNPLACDPPFKSNIDVRREEPVFSGKKNWADGSEGGRRGGKTKRVLVGAAWLAACSYAVGVVAEFFRTGGSDGVGTVGF